MIEVAFKALAVIILGRVVGFVLVKFLSWLHERKEV